MSRLKLPEIKNSRQKGFPGPEQKPSSFFVFIFKFIGMIIFAGLDNLWGLISRQYSFIVNFFKKRRMEDVLEKYRNYKERLGGYTEKMSDFISSNMSVKTAHNKITEFRKEHFDRDEEKLIFGHGESRHNFRDFQREFMEFVQKVKNLKKGPDDPVDKSKEKQDHGYIHHDKKDAS